MTAAEWTEQFTALLTVAPVPTPLPAPPDMAAAMEAFGGKWGPMASGRNDALAEFLTRLKHQLETQAMRTYSAVEETIRNISTAAEHLARLDKLPGGVIWWDKTPAANRVQFTLPLWQMGGLGPPCYHAVRVDQTWSPPEAAVTTIGTQGRYVVFGMQIRPWVSSGFARVQGEALAKYIAEQDRRNTLVAEEANRRYAIESQPVLSREQMKEKAQDEEIAKLKAQVERLAAAK